MKFKNRKITAIILLLVLCASMMLFASGCTKKESKYKETEYFIYHIYDAGDHKEARIDRLTEKGKQLKNIVIPEEIDGYIVTSLDTHAETPNLRKIVVSYNVRSINSWLSDGNLFVHGYPQGLKVLYINCRYIKGTLMEPDFYIATAAKDNFQKLNPGSYAFANMQYLFNYENAQNEGVFFIDDLDIGEELEIIPEIPKRDGFAFTGWYAEPECTNKVELNGYVKTDEEIVYLYAGWKENNK